MLSKFSGLALTSLILAGTSQVLAIDACPADSDPSNSVCNVNGESQDAHPRRICGMQGSVANGALNTMMSCTAQGADDCRDRCLAAPLCKSYSFSLLDNSCTGYTKGIRKMRFTSSADNGVYFAHRGCFTWDTNCAPPCTDLGVFTSPGFFPFVWTDFFQLKHFTAVKQFLTDPDPRTTVIEGARSDCEALHKCAAFAESEWTSAVLGSQFFLSKASDGTYTCQDFGTTPVDVQYVHDANDFYAYQLQDVAP